MFSSMQTSKPIFIFYFSKFLVIYPITSMDTERSVFKYKYFLSDNYRLFNFNNIEYGTIVQSNNFR